MVFKHDQPGMIEDKAFFVGGFSVNLHTEEQLERPIGICIEVSTIEGAGCSTLVTTVQLVSLEHQALSVTVDPKP